MKTIALLILVISQFAHAEACETYQGDMRVDTPAALKRLENVCVVTGGLGIFVPGVKQISFPRLVSVHLINVESAGLEAISFPALEEADYFYISGGQLKTVEVPHLRSVPGTFSFRVRHLKTLNLPSLGTTGLLVMEGNLDLEFVFADSLYKVSKLQLNGNPLLNAGSVAVLQGVTHVESDEEKAAIAHYQDVINTLKHDLLDKALNPPPLPPTGHPTYIGGVNTATYYAWYPYYYYRYWNDIHAWGYDSYYY